jgi:hypothetical protein
LLLGHPDRNRGEIIEETGAAEMAPADAHAAYHHGLVTNPYLAHLNAGPKAADQFLYQQPEIHPFLGRVIKNGLEIIQGDFHGHQFHGKLLMGDAGLAIFAIFALFELIFSLPG